MSFFLFIVEKDKRWVMCSTCLFTLNFTNIQVHFATPPIRPVLLENLLIQIDTSTILSSSIIWFTHVPVAKLYIWLIWNPNPFYSNINIICSDPEVRVLQC